MKTILHFLILALALRIPSAAKGQTAEQPSKAAAVEEIVASADKQEEESEKPKVPLLTAIDQLLGQGIREAKELEDLNEVLKDVESFALLILLDKSRFDTKNFFQNKN